jgi:hypothetical protein
MALTIYDPYIGPTHKPTMVEQFHSHSNHSLGQVEYKSSMLPASTMAGTAEAYPEMKRPMNTPAGDGTTPTNKHEML